jgi:hypothetical protein
VGSVLVPLERERLAILAKTQSSPAQTQCDIVELLSSIGGRVYPYVLPFFPRLLTMPAAGPEETKNQRDNILRLIQIRLTNKKVYQSNVRKEIGPWS